MSEVRIVVTGAAGFIGSRLLADLSSRHPAADLLAVDHPVLEAKQANLGSAPGVMFLGHSDFIEALEAGRLDPRLILHMGACSSTTEQDWGFLAENNLRYSQRLWSWCAARGSRLIYASSAATYGDGSDGFDDALPSAGSLRSISTAAPSISSISGSRPRSLTAGLARRNRSG